MTDLEIDRALALAIGYQPTKVQAHESLWVYHDRHGWRVFSHKDWNVIGPIAKKFRLLVDFKACVAWQPNMSVGTRGDTPQKAIALAVIGAKHGTKT